MEDTCRPTAPDAPSAFHRHSFHQARVARGGGGAGVGDLADDGRGGDATGGRSVTIALSTVAPAGPSGSQPVESMRRCKGYALRWLPHRHVQASYCLSAGVAERFLLVHALLRRATPNFIQSTTNTLQGVWEQLPVSETRIQEDTPRLLTPLAWAGDTPSPSSRGAELLAPFMPPVPEKLRRCSPHLQCSQHLAEAACILRCQPPSTQVQRQALSHRRGDARQRPSRKCGARRPSRVVVVSHQESQQHARVHRNHGCVAHCVSRFRAEQR